MPSNHRSRRRPELVELPADGPALAAAGAVQTLRAIRRQIDALRLALLEPTAEDLEQCLPSLLDAIESLSSVEQYVQVAERGAAGSLSFESASALRAELKTLKIELRVVIRLVENGAAFWQHWARFLAAAEGGYLSTGEPAALPSGGSVSFRG